ncbi:hypothetical protein FY034_13220 [Trichlorobacter lovleyi]|uniref:hypothetical protein n=1 Tax=Trichlorobacter lovleyi TaxID=313985 RepID=UPI00223F01A5|nr:hypothetical protein [Trichlorobacter lovleyi]QOX79851.1 hypothetical protein FY034_13220 [Trichlorobacter lovleyi]
MADEVIHNQQRPWAGRFIGPGSDESERYVVYLPSSSKATSDQAIEQHSEHTDENSALQQCHELINSFLSEAIKPGMSCSTLFDLYRHEGPDPYIVFELGCFSKLAYAFNAWQYAEVACYQLCNEKQPQLLSRSLARLQGRYNQYNRLQLAAHLLQFRPVCVTRVFTDSFLPIPAGTPGKIGLGSPYISGWEFDWSIELPVIFQRDGMDDITIGIPYGHLEFVQSDEEYLALKAAMRATTKAKTEGA